LDFSIGDKGQLNLNNISIDKIINLQNTLNKKVDSIDELVKVLLKFMQESEDDVKYFEDDLYTDRPLRFFIAEIIREKALYLLDKEIPHGIAVAIKKYEETENLAEIDAEIICEKQSHKQIIIGKGGEMLKKIGHLARVSFQKVAQKKVYLNLFVKVKENWKNSPSYLNEIGYDGSEI
jgi:GTP-binding protein Era